jgi:hypothetical protein
MACFPKHFLVSGIPASGKSAFCRWLEANNDYVHLDVEKSGVLDCHGLATAWHILLEGQGSAAPFVEGFKKFNRPVVIDWGFPPEHLKAVRRMSEAGIVLWWFTADPSVARREFVKRQQPSVEMFDVQMKKIQSSLTDIESVFGSHNINALPSSGLYASPEKILECMLHILGGGLAAY